MNNLFNDNNTLIRMVNLVGTIPYIQTKRRNRLKRKIISEELANIQNDMKIRRFCLAHYRRQQRKSSKRSCWVLPELQLNDHDNFWNVTVLEYDEAQFQNNFRVSRKTFKFLCERLHPYLKKTETTMRKAIPVPKRIAISLTYLKGNADFSTVASLFGVGKSTIGFLIYEFCDSLNDALYSKTVKFPRTEAQKREIANKFDSKWSFPDCFGAMDGTHIPINSPANFPEDYYNIKSFYSFHILAIVDSDYKFMYLNIGKPGRCDDATVFKESSLVKELENAGTDMHLIGADAFPLLPWLMKPYPSTESMSLSEINYNKRLSSARTSVENAFRRLKGRWRLLLKKSDLNVQRIKVVTRTCIILNNICEEFQDHYPEEWLEEVINNSTTGCVTDDQIVSEAAVKKRNLIAEKFMLDEVPAPT